MLRIFMFYKQHVLADLKLKKQCGQHKHTFYRLFCMHGAVTYAPLRLQLAEIRALFGSQNAIFVKQIYMGMLIDHV